MPTCVTLPRAWRALPLLLWTVEPLSERSGECHKRGIQDALGDPENFPAGVGGDALEGTVDVVGVDVEQGGKR